MPLTTNKWVARPWLSFSSNVRAPDTAGVAINASHEILRGTPAAPNNGAYVSARGWIRADNRPFADQISDFTNQSGGSDNRIFYLPNVDEKGATAPLDTWVMTGTAGSGQYPGADIATCAVGGIDYQERQRDDDPLRRCGQRRLDCVDDRLPRREPSAL